jgi:hypothetical protein
MFDKKTTVIGIREYIFLLNRILIILSHLLFTYLVNKRKRKLCIQIPLSSLQVQYVLLPVAFESKSLQRLALRNFLDSYE